MSETIVDDEADLESNREEFVVSLNDQNFLRTKNVKSRLDLETEALQNKLTENENSRMFANNNCTSFAQKWIRNSVRDVLCISTSKLLGKLKVCFFKIWLPITVDSPEINPVNLTRFPYFFSFSKHIFKHINAPLSDLSWKSKKYSPED